MRFRGLAALLSVASSLVLACAGASLDEAPGGGTVPFTSNGSATASDADGGDTIADATADSGSATGGEAGGTVTESGGCVVSDEVCDLADNDCDGMVDETDPGAGAACETGMPGGCAKGTMACSDGELACVPDAAAAAELCNGIDDDCDGDADEDEASSGADCDTGMLGVCAAGTIRCESGAEACAQSTLAGAEACNDLDDNCNGQVDEGNPGSGGGCNTGMPGVCAGGTESCSDGAFICVQSEFPQAEICGNGLDDDCNGAADDACGCSHDLCAIGGLLVSGCDPCVTSICAADPFCCASSWDAQCVLEVGSICGDLCVGSCAHTPCSTGTVLVSGCDPGGCVATICGADPFCCNDSWDQACVSQVQSVCGVVC